MEPRLSRWIAGAALAVFCVSLSARDIAGQDEGTGVLRGLVYDSTSMKHLPGARVAVIGTSAVVETDENGRFVLADVPAGSHWVSFYHSRLQELGVSAPSRQVELAAGETVDVQLAVPSEETLLMGWCLAEQSEPGSAVIAGTVTDSITGVPMPRAIVTAEPISRRPGMPQPVEVRTDDSGYFRICSLRPGVDMRIQAHFGMNSGIAVETVLAPGSARIQNLVLLMSAEGTLSGVVRDYVSGDPITGAQVSVLGTESRTLTDQTGRFVLDDLPPGRHLVTTDHLAFEQRIDSVTIFSQETVDIEVRMATEALEVEGLVVTARTRFGRTSLAGEDKRADFIGREEIDVLLPRVATVADLLRNMNTPGLRIREVMTADPLTGVMLPGYCVEISRRSGGEGCTPAAIVLNGMLQPYPEHVLRELDPQSIDRMEVLSPVDAVFQFGAQAGNGAVLIFTR